jgi:hypothetical protein
MSRLLAAYCSFSSAARGRSASIGAEPERHYSAEQQRRNDKLGVAISFWDYFRVGAPLTLITLVIGTLWLSL